ncbi:hypothetical protein AOLI_G00297650 [Acnodon oligacanthus]
MACLLTSRLQKTQKRFLDPTTSAAAMMRRLAPVITKYLARRHHVENKEELDLLLVYATGRFKCHLNCTICDKKHLFRLD